MCMCHLGLLFINRSHLRSIHKRREVRRRYISKRGTICTDSLELPDPVSTLSHCVGLGDRLCRPLESSTGKYIMYIASACLGHIGVQGMYFYGIDTIECKKMATGHRTKANQFYERVRGAGKVVLG